jgi:hypothetical protein
MSSMRQEKPHSLSYQPKTRSSPPPVSRGLRQRHHHAFGPRAQVGRHQRPVGPADHAAAFCRCHQRRVDLGHARRAFRLKSDRRPRRWPWAPAPPRRRSAPPDRAAPVQQPLALVVVGTIDSAAARERARSPARRIHRGLAAGVAMDRRHPAGAQPEAESSTRASGAKRVGGAGRVRDDAQIRRQQVLVRPQNHRRLRRIRRPEISTRPAPATSPRRDTSTVSARPVHSSTMSMSDRSSPDRSAATAQPDAVPIDHQRARLQRDLPRIGSENAIVFKQIGAVFCRRDVVDRDDLQPRPCLSRQRRAQHRAPDPPEPVDRQPDRHRHPHHMKAGGRGAAREYVISQGVAGCKRPRNRPRSPARAPPPGQPPGSPPPDPAGPPRCRRTA